MAKGGARQGAGRKRKPVAKHKLDGTYRKDQHGHYGGAAADGVPQMPDDLPPRAVAFWERNEPQLAQWSSELDSDAFAEMCRWYAVYRDAMDEADVKSAATAWDKCNSLMARFGMTPADRAKMEVKPAMSDDDLEAKHFGVVG